METGSCQCKKITYSFERDKVISTHNCHCKDCQKSTGSGKATLLYIAKKNLSVSGELKFFETKGSLGLNIKRGFCENCGSGVLSYAKELPMLRFLKAGTLHDSSWVKVDSNFFSESAHEWNKVDKEVKSFKGNPDMISNIKAVLKAL